MKRKKGRAVPEIPDEILQEILSRLPVAPILRFRSVSKSWKGLIDSPDFVRKHLHQSQKSNSHLDLIIQSDRLYSTELDVLSDSRSYFYEELPHLLKHPSYPDRVEVFGSCNGLLALYNVKDTILLNPSTRSFHKLPDTGIEVPEKYDKYSYNIVFGFGYDSVGDDYKVVRMVEIFDSDMLDVFDTQVKVYSLKSHAWRRTQDFPYFLFYAESFGVLANGAFHWVVTRNRSSLKDRLIAAFDLGTEEYRLVPFVDFADTNFVMILEVLGGCLCVSCNYKMDHLDVWVMKEYGVKKSWTILFTLRYGDVSFDHQFVRPITYSRCGKKVLLSDGYILFWYDPHKRSIYFPLAHSLFKDDDFEVHTCMQSLVLLDDRSWNPET